MSSPSWSSGETARGETNLSQVTLRDIKAISRDNLDEVVFECSGALSIHARRHNGTINVLFENATSGLPRPDYVPAALSTVSRIYLEERPVRGVPVLGVIVELNGSVGEGAPFFQILVDRFVLYIPQNGPANLALWSATEGELLNYRFANLGTAPSASAAEPVNDPAGYSDMPGVNANASHLAAQALPVSSAASIQTTVLSTVAQPAGASGGVTVRIKGNRVNLRSGPSTESTGNVIVSLPGGTAVTLLEATGEWLRVRVDEQTSGWIFASLTDFRHQPPAVAAPAMSSGGVSGGPAATTPASEQLQPVVYKRIGRDPFVAIDPEDLIQEGLLNVENSSLVGILHDANERIAVLEDHSQGGVAYALRENDQVVKGKLLKIKENQAVFLIFDMGTSHTYTLKMKTVSDK